MRHASQQRRGEPRPQHLDVFFHAGHLRIDLVGDPAGQAQAARADGLRGQQRVVEATEAQSHHQDHRQAEPRGEVGAVLRVAERHTESAGALDDEKVGAAAQFVEAAGDDFEIDGDAVVLRGGSAALHSNRALVGILQSALESVGLPGGAVQSIDAFGRAGARELMRARGLVDVLIPRGSADLIRAVVDESTVPVIETGAGVVHLFLDETAELESSIEIVRNSKVQRPSVCNALETLLVHRSAAGRLLPGVLAALREAGVTLHADEETVALFPDAVPATEDDWASEYLSLDLAVRVVDGLDEALEHIRRYSTHHTESILTNDAANAERFLAEVDSAAVLVNASTRFTDGGEFGFGAEVGISTQKLHARGPMGLRELTSTKWLVRGSGQVRG